MDAIERYFSAVEEAGGASVRRRKARADVRPNLEGVPTILMDYFSDLALRFDQESLSVGFPRGFYLCSEHGARNRLPLVNGGPGFENVPFAFDGRVGLFCITAGENAVHLRKYASGETLGVAAASVSHFFNALVAAIHSGGFARAGEAALVSESVAFENYVRECGVSEPLSWWRLDPLAREKG